MSSIATWLPGAMQSTEGKLGNNSKTQMPMVPALPLILIILTGFIFLLYKK